MDKDEFVRLAPYYYALGILHYLARRGGPATEAQMQEFYSDGQDNPDPWCYFGREKIFDRAVGFLVDAAILEAIRDPFAPQLLRETSESYQRKRALFQNTEYPFFRYEMAGNSDHWIREALRNLEQEADRQKLSPNDFDAPSESEWEPLPLDRDDPDLKAAIEKIDETAEQVRADNGYAVTVPEERAYVLDSLTTLSKRLKEAGSISILYLRRYGLEPLTRLARRFKDNALGLLAMTAKELLKDWLKKRGITFLDEWL